MKRWIILILLVALTTGMATALYLRNAQAPGSALSQSGLGGEFTLSSLSGEVSLADFRGKVVLLYFGFASCPDICPTTLAAWRQAFDLLTEQEASRVAGIFISVDPERDSLQQLNSYTRFFSERIVGLTGTRQAIDEVVRQYGAYYRLVPLEDSALGYTVDHSSRVYLIDTDGKLQDSVLHNVDPAELAGQIRALINH